MPPRHWLTLSAIATAALAAACANPQPLRVNSHIVRDQVHDTGSIDPMARNEKLRRLHGAVSMEERKQRLGQYFDVHWHHPEGQHQAPVTITFEYQQGATASKIKTIRREFPAELAHGHTEIAIIGDDYFDNGRVLAWRTTLRRGNETIATRRSYLWQ